MLTYWLLIAHLVGDYVLQSDWMANEKTKKSLAALAHAVTYSLPFLLITRSVLALLVICGTHFVIDRWRLARYVCWLKNFAAPKWIKLEWFTPMNNGQYSKYLKDSHVDSRGLHVAMIRNHPWSVCSSTGYEDGKPAWLSVWLMIIADNTLHLICNGLAVRYLGGDGG